MATPLSRKQTAGKKATASRATKPRRLHDMQFLGESPAYRRARNKVLQAEIELRRAIESVAKSRRKLPPGGIVRKDYVFEEATKGGAAKTVKLSELFAPGKDTLVVYNFMYQPDNEPCPSCTSIIDSVDGAAQHVTQRINLVVVAKAPIRRFLAHAKRRGWQHARLLSSVGNTYNHDYFGETPDGDQTPMLNVFVRQGGKVRHFWGSELLFAPTDRGQDMRHVDMIWPVWHLLDVTPAGRATGPTGKDFPSLSYAPESRRR